MDFEEGRPLVEAIFTEEGMRGFRVAFYGFVKLLCDPIHILKLFDEALPVGRSGAKCRMFYGDDAGCFADYGS